MRSRLKDSLLLCMRVVEEAARTALSIAGDH